MIDTHYLYRPPALDANTFRAFAADVDKLLRAAQADVFLAGEDGTGKPEVDDYRIAFNGDGSVGADHEPLIIEQTFTGRRRPNEEECFSFVKTQGKPYDKVVVAVLYAFLYHFPSCKFVTDSKQDELKPGFDLFFRVCEPRGDLDRLFKRPVADRELAK